MSLKESGKKYVKRGAFAFGALIVFNLVKDNPDGAKTATKESAGQTADAVNATKDLGGAAISGAVDHSPFHLTITNPLETPRSATHNISPTPLASSGSSSETHLVVHGDTWWGILGGFGLNDSQIQRCVVDKDLQRVEILPGNIVGNPC